jgi:predicted nucleotidyltransferase
LDDFVLTHAERVFLAELDARGVRYLIVGLTAAGLQGANTTTVDIDLWFESTADPGIGEAATAAGGMWVSGFGMMPARLGGPLGDRFDVVLHMSGLGRFDEELARAIDVTVEGIHVRVLPLDRVLASKRAAGRPKDQAAIPALEEALAALEGSKE